MPPRGPTPYFLYSEEQRTAAKEELLAANAKAGVAQVAQLIGKKWGALSDEEKQAYKDRAQQLREEAAVAAAAAAGQQSPGGETGQAAEEGPAAPAAGAPPPPFGFPTGVVKRIMLVDEEVQRVSADAVRAIAKATELLVQQLAVRALEQAQAHKKKNFRLPEVLHVAGRDRRLCDMGLKEVLEQHAASAAAAAAAAGDDGEGAEGENAASKRASKRQKQDENAAAGTKQITSFFHTAAVQ